jgi:purine-cytosine permease-like protein
MTSLRNRLARLVERSPARVVAEDDRRGWFFLAAIQIGVSICVPLFALGGQLGRHARFIDLVPAVFAACGILMSSTAIIGFRALGKVAYVAVPLLLAVITVPTWIALRTHDVGPLLGAPPAEAPYTFGLIVAIISGGHMVAVTIAPDLTRFLRSSRDAGWRVSPGGTETTT